MIDDWHANDLEALSQALYENIARQWMFLKYSNKFVQSL